MLNLNKTRWRLIEELSKGNKTPSELAKKLRITPPSIHSQLKSMQAERLVKRVGEIKGKTRPYAEYSIGAGFVYFLKALPNETQQGFIECDENLKLHLRIWSIPQKEYHYYIESFWWQIQDYLDDIDTIAVYGSVASGKARQGSDIDVLVLVKKDVKKYEERLNAVIVGQKGKKEVVMAQVFETNDFENSLKKGSKFAEEVIKENIILYDPCNNLEKIKNGLKRKTG